MVAMVTATAAAADKIDRIKIYDHNKTVYVTTPIDKTVCKDVQVPVYEDVQVQGNAAEGALAGMIIGGILGKGVSGKDDGAAAGAIIGGLIGADKGAKPKTKRQVIGYELVQRCEEVTSYEQRQRQVYSHSTIRFYLNGKRYVLEFQR